MRNYFLFIFFAFITLSASAQDDLFNTKTPKLPARKGWIFAVNGDVDVPAGTLAKEFGIDYRIGPTIYYKTKSNWMFGVKGDFLTGNKIKADSFMKNIEDADGNVINSSGERVTLPTYERGYLLGVNFGKIFNTSKKVQDNGILWMNSIGFIQHKIDIYVRNNDVPQLKGDYLKGYDRLTNGMYVEEYGGYTYFAKDGLLNFHLGVDVVAAITKDRRGYIYDVMRTDNSTHLDMMIGIRGGIYLPLFKRKSEEFYFQ